MRHQGNSRSPSPPCPMDRRSNLIRNWTRDSGVLWPRPQPSGASICCGLNLLIILPFRFPHVVRSSNVCTITGHPVLRARERGRSSIHCDISLIRQCCKTWIRARQTLLRTSSQYKSMADRRRTKGPAYQVGQRLWLITRDLPLRSDCKKLSPRFIGPFLVSKVINPVTSFLGP